MNDCLIFTMAIIITWIAGSWLYCFMNILLVGSLLLCEPVLWILIAEFILAMTLTMLGLEESVMQVVVLFRGKEKR